MEIQKFKDKSIHSLGIVECLTLLQRQKVYIICCIDDTGNSKNGMCDRDTSSQLAIVLNVVDEERGIVEIANYILDLIQDWKPDFSSGRS